MEHKKCLYQEVHYGAKHSENVLLEDKILPDNTGIEPVCLFLLEMQAHCIEGIGDQFEIG